MSIASRRRPVAALALAALVVAVLVVAAAAPAGAEEPELKLGAITVSPDGKLVACEVWQAGVIRLHVLDHLEKGGLRGLARRVGRAFSESELPARHAVTRAEDDAHCPVFLPGGDYLSFLSARADPAVPQVWLLPLTLGEPEVRTNAAGGVAEYAWGPDHTLWYVAPEAPGGFLWKLPPGSDGTIVVPTGPSPPREITVSFDGARIAFVSGEGEGDLSVLDTTPSEVRRLTDRAGAERSPHWSEDGETVFFLAAREPGSDPTLGIHAVPAAGGPVTLVSERVTGEVHEFTSCRDSRRLYAIVAEAEGDAIYRIRTRGGRVKRLAGAKGSLHHLATHRKGEHSYFVLDPPGFPDEGEAPEIVSWTFPDDYLETLTDFNTPSTERTVGEEHDR